MKCSEFEVWKESLKQEGYDIDNMAFLEVIELIKLKEAKDE